MLFLILGFVLFYTIIYIALPVAAVFAIIAFIKYLSMKKYEVFRNIAIILFILSKIRVKNSSASTTAKIANCKLFFN